MDNQQLDLPYHEVKTVTIQVGSLVFGMEIIWHFFLPPLPLFLSLCLSVWLSLSIFLAVFLSLSLSVCCKHPCNVMRLTFNVSHFVVDVRLFAQQGDCSDVTGIRVQKGQDRIITCKKKPVTCYWSTSEVQCFHLDFSRNSLRDENANVGTLALFESLDFSKYSKGNWGMRKLMSRN